MKTKRILIAVMALALASPLFVAAPASATAVPVTPSTATYPQNRSLSVSQIEARLAALDATYNTVGELVSPVDAEFLKIYGNLGVVGATASGGQAPLLAQPLDEIQAWNINKYGSLGTANGHITGNIHNDIGTTIANSWHLLIDATGSGPVSKITNCAHVHSYGIAGQNGVGLVYYYDNCATVASTINNYGRSASYTAFVGTTTIDTTSTFYTPTGSFDVPVDVTQIG
jgi:hypothetical protein